jgi:L-seryl-tRNA(Ser) seleniumtransferase
MSNPFRQLPAVHEILATARAQALTHAHAHELVAEATRAELEALRQQLRDGQALNGEVNAETVAERVATRLAQELRPKLRSVINATGIILHTNLGRAPIAEAAAKAAYEAGRGYLNLELDLETGQRSHRQDAIRDWLTRLTGAESATVVNNNAAATVIALRALATGKEVIVSRGQLVEIGGSFRIPDIMRVSGAVLKEVGTTNITRTSDYENAITENTAALLRVHCSNYRIYGHTETPALEELIALGKKRGLLVIDDIGSGALVDFRRWGLHDEPLARDSIAAGVDLVLFSGDKLLGGPQAGILAGKKELIRRIEKDPLMRAFRVDKMTLAALEATLRIYLHEEQALQEIPILHMLETPLATLRERAEALAKRLREIEGLASVAVQDDHAFVGGGSLPDQSVPTVVVAVQARALSDSEFAYRLRSGHPAVMPRVQEGRVLFDLRTIFPEQINGVIAALSAAVSLEKMAGRDAARGC